MPWLLSIMNKCKGYVIAFLGLIATIGVAMLYAFRKGGAAASAKYEKQNVEETKQVLKETQQSIGVRNEIDTSVEKLPDVGKESIENAPADSAAGQLRDGGWMRSDGGKG